MAPEFAVMARAVMHSALERVLPEDSARDLLRAGRRGRLGLEAHIDAAVTAGMGDDAVQQAMRRIKAAGDDAAHRLPQFAPEPREVMEDLSLVLRHLESYDSAS